MEAIRAIFNRECVILFNEPSNDEKSCDSDSDQSEGDDTEPDEEPVVVPVKVAHKKAKGKKGIKQQVGEPEPVAVAAAMAEVPAKKGKKKVGK